MKKFIIPIIILILFILLHDTTSNALEINYISVDIKGAVINPGVYEIENGSTLYDLIGLAGGLREYADTSIVNLSKRLKDEDVVVIYTIDEVRSYTSGDTNIKVIDTYCTCPKIEPVACINKNSSILVDINKATKEELETLPGIGESKAISIIEYRTSKPFEKIEDIMNVKGIGKTIYEKIKDSIRV